MASIRKRTWNSAAGEQRAAWVVDFSDAAGNRDRRQFATKREATDFRVEVEGQIRGGTFRANAAKITVADVCGSYLAQCEARMNRGERFTRHHLAVVRGHVGNHILHREHGVGAVKLAHLTAGIVGDFRDRLRGAGVSVPTARKVVSTLHSVLEFAIGRDLVAVNAAKGVKVIGRRDEGSKKIVPPSKDAMRRLVAAATDDFRVKLIFASATGVRAGEFHALRWQHVDLEKGELVVETRVDAYGDEDVTKTAAGMRTVPLGRTVVAMLKEWRLRSRFSKSDDLVFPNGRGSYESHDNLVKRRFAPACEKATLGKHEKLGLDEKGAPILRFRPSINWHSLRHFAVSTWIEAGLSPKTVQTFAGHSSLQVTMDRYGHLFPSDDHRQAMDAIASEVFR